MAIFNVILLQRSLWLQQAKLLANSDMNLIVGK